MEQVLTLLRNTISLIRWQDIVDIILIWYLFYKVMRIISGTSAGQVLKGVLVLIVALQVFKVMQFNVLSYLLSSAMQIGILALIILFQPELRRMLDSLGRSRWPDFFSESRENNDNEYLRSLANIVDACGYFSRSKTGALIVLERETKLGEIIKTGILLNADISGGLLKNVFYNKAPLHDGAVIIRDSKVAAAACVLPLSSNTDLSPELGTRHRAGIGMSEVSDAVVIIVSEETGAVSVATGGQLKRHLSPETLKAVLNKEMLSSEDNRRRLEKFKFWRWHRQ